MEHPESPGSQAIEPSVNELVKHSRFTEALKSLGEKELRELCKKLGYQALVAYPAALRWLAREAAMGIRDEHERHLRGEALVSQLVQDGGLHPPPLADEAQA